MIVRTCALAALMSIGGAVTAQALPPGYYAGPPGPYAFRYGFKPYRFADGYGPGRFYRRGLPNGTGYRGRGTLTGGPSGGLPNRN